ncbi:MAG: FkbM family methyltransferase [Sphingomicrobium sp.]
MDVRSAIQRNWQDVANFGPGFLLRHLGRLRKDGLASVSVPGFGRLFLRPGSSDAQVVRQIFADREYEAYPPHLQARLTAKYREMLASGRKPVIVDAGANIGAASLWFSKIYPGALIVAIEPDASNVAVLRKNMAGLSNVTVLDAAIGAEPGFASLDTSRPSWGIRTERSSAGVRVVTVADALDASGGDTLFLVKVDIEGFESDLFAANTEWLDTTLAVIIEPHDWLMPGKRTSRSFQRALAARPFEIFIRGENLFYVRES